MYFEFQIYLVSMVFPQCVCYLTKVICNSIFSEPQFRCLHCFRAPILYGYNNFRAHLRVQHGIRYLHPNAVRKYYHRSSVKVQKSRRRSHFRSSNRPNHPFVNPSYNQVPPPVSYDNVRPPSIVFPL